MFNKILKGITWWMDMGNELDKKAWRFLTNSAFEPKPLTPYQKASVAAKNGDHDQAESILVDLALNDLLKEFNQQANLIKFNASQRDAVSKTISVPVRGERIKIWDRDDVQVHVLAISNPERIIDHPTTKKIEELAKTIGLSPTFSCSQSSRVFAGSKWERHERFDYERHANVIHARIELDLTK